MENKYFYDRKGKRVCVTLERNFYGVTIYVEGKFYSRADDRAEALEIVDELVSYRGLSVGRTSPKRSAQRMAFPGDRLPT